MSYKQIHETFWTDPQAKKYKPLHRYLFGYFISGPHAHYSGLYYLPVVYIQNDTGLAPKEIKEGIAFLSSQGHIFYDKDREIIFVKSELIYQWDSKDADGKPKMNPKQVAGVKKHFDTLHKTPLISKFLEIYAYLNIDYTGMDRGINTGMDRVFVPVPVPVPVPEGVQEGGAGGNEPPDPPPKKDAPKPRDADFIFILPEYIDPKAWAAFEEMRKKIGSPMTEYAKHLIICDLDKLKGDKAAILDQSTKNNWKGVFEIKEGGFNGNNGRAGAGQSGTQTADLERRYPVDVCE